MPGAALGAQRFQQDVQKVPRLSCKFYFCPGNPFVWRAINLLSAPNDDAPPAFLKFAAMMIFMSRGEGSWRSDRTAKNDFDLYCSYMLCKNILCQMIYFAKFAVVK